MANNNININITATGQPAITEIKRVEAAVTQLGTKATANFTLTGIDDIQKQVATLSSKMAGIGGGKVKLNTGFVFSTDFISKTEKSISDFNTKVTNALGSSSKTIETFNSKIGNIGKNNTAFSNISESINGLKANSVSSLGTIATNATSNFNKISTKAKEVGSNIDNIGSRMRYLSLVSGVIFAGLGMATMGFVKAARDAENATMKLMVAAQTTGNSFENLQTNADKLVSTGFLTMAEASDSLANSVMAGLSAEQAYLFVLRMTETALVKKQNANDSYGEAVKKSTLGLMTHREVVLDSAGAEIVLKDAYKTFADEFNNGNKKLTKQQETLAIYNATMKQTERYAGVASLASATFSGSLTKLNANVMLMKTSLGNSLVPLVGTLAVIIDSVSIKIKNFSDKNQEMTMVIIAGTVATAALITVMAGVGALFNMFSSSIGGMITMFRGLFSVSAVMLIAKIAAISIAIGGLIYMILKVTGKWDTWKNSMSSLGAKIKQAMSNISGATKDAGKVTEELAKKFADLKYNIGIFIRDTKQDMAQWVADLDKKIADNTTEIEDLTKAYEKATAKIKSSFDSAMADNSLSHARKTEDLQQQIDDEVSKGIWADQTKIKELRKELKRENEDYQLASDEKIATKDEELAQEKDVYTEKLAKLKAELDAEKKLETDHATEIANIRSWNVKLLDDYDKMFQRFNDNAVQQLKQLSEVSKEVSTAAEEALTNLNNLENEANKPYEGTNSAVTGAMDWASKIGLILGAVGIATIGLKSLPVLVEKYFSEAYINILYFLDKFTKIKISPIPILIVFEWAMYWGNKIIKEVSDLEKEIDSLIKEATANSDYRISLAKGMLERGAITKEEYNKILKRETDSITALANDLKPVAESSWFDIWGSTWTYENFIKSINLQPFTKIGEWASKNLFDPINANIIKLGESTTSAFVNVLTIMSNDFIIRLNILKTGFDNWKGGFKTGWDNFWNSLPSILNGMWQTVRQNFANFINPIIATTNGLIGGMNNISGRIGIRVPTIPELRFKEGGIVPGNINQEVPIIAHGGETILPAGVAPVTINIYNPSVRSNADIQSIAQAVKDVISREMALKRYI